MATFDEVGNELPRLIRAHPEVLGRPFSMPSSLPPGWLGIADRLCADLERILGGAAQRFQPVQSKEKWGSWRLYWMLDGDGGFHADVETPDRIDDPAGLDDDRCDDAVEISGTSAGFRLATVPAGDQGRAIHLRVREAERESERTCWVCGQAGEAWTDGWLHTACEAHRRRKAIRLRDWHATQSDAAKATDSAAARRTSPPAPVLRHWRRIADGVLVGQVSGHPKLPEGSWLVSSPRPTSLRPGATSGSSEMRRFTLADPWPQNQMMPTAARDVVVRWLMADLEPLRLDNVREALGSAERIARSVLAPREAGASIL